MLFCRKNTDFVKNLIGQAQRKDALVSCHAIPPNEQVLKVLYSVFCGVYALKRQLSDSTFSIFFQKFSRGADAPFGFFEGNLLVSAHFRGLE